MAGIFGLLGEAFELVGGLAGLALDNAGHEFEKQARKGGSANYSSEDYRNTAEALKTFSAGVKDVSSNIGENIKNKN